MLFSIGLIMMCGLIMGELFKKARVPALFGMILAGIAMGPYMLNLIDGSILAISADLRKIALIIILIRAGLKLSVDDLKKIGRPAILMCFLPATFEIAGMALFAPKLLGISLLDALTLGAVVGAVSPAVIVPGMIKLIDGGYGTKKGIPQMILAGASVDDVYVIVLFTTFTSLAQGGNVSVARFINIPISIVTGVLAGLAVGKLLIAGFNRMHIRDTVKVIIMMAMSFFMVTVEDRFPALPFASLIAIMAMGLAIKQGKSHVAKRLSSKFDKLWVLAEIFLFVLVGASVAVTSLVNAGVKVVLLLALVLIFRMVGVFICMSGTPLNVKEKLFCMIAYTPKATVQAAIGGLPLAMGLGCGEIVLAVSVVAILITAPVGAFMIDLTYKKWLEYTPAEE